MRNNIIQKGNEECFPDFPLSPYILLLFTEYIEIQIQLGRGGVQGQGKGLRLMGTKAVNDNTGLATGQSKNYEA